MPKPRAPRIKKPPNHRNCYGCGWEDVPILSLKTCPFCGSDKCPQCDTGDNAKCGNCPEDR